ncbi:MAG: type VI secretion system-associated FHA domain protein TagH [Rubrivivax sp.]|nr:type VI secretion system-associated FHA domain protein TagH [Rubrivivax sp.]
MIVLAVMTYNGAATQPVEASFDELGGTIGRADGNLMVLPDPERTISRVHAKVVFRNGTYAVEDRGSNPILVNGNVVGHGKEWPLAPGDVLQIGGYELGVRASGSPAVSDDPFADVFAAGGAKVMAPAPAPAFAAPPPPVTAARRTAPAPPPGAVGIPSDWDPLAEETFAGRSPAPAAGRDEGDAGGLLGAGGAEESIDDLFGLGDKAAKPGAGWPADDDFLGVFDPGSPSVGGVGERVDKPRIEDARLDHQRSELAAAFPSSMPTARTVPPAPQPRVPDPPSPPTPVPALGEAPRGAVVSWDGGARQATIVAPASAGRRQGGGAMASISGGTRPGIRPRAPASAEAQAPAPATGGDELLRALLEGLGGVQAPGITALTPGLMKLVGTLLAESVRGAVDLLQARASIKREVRAEVTAIRPRQNNPLKFSPTAALALQHLLGPPVPGFLRADEAMRDAYRDLRAHELAVMAGMRSALAGLLQRFDPKALESRITGKSGLGMLLAGGRRAQLWEAYQELFGQLSAEAEDDFHQVFGRAFLQAYEDQLDRLNNSEGGGSS